MPARLIPDCSTHASKAPTGPDPEDAQFIDRPEGSRILGAAKITGKLGDGWNVGFVTAVTDREYADVQFEKIDGQEKAKRAEVEVEPLSSFNVLRIQKEFDKGTEEDKPDKKIKAARR